MTKLFSNHLTGLHPKTKISNEDWHLRWDISQLRATLEMPIGNLSFQLLPQSAHGTIDSNRKSILRRSTKGFNPMFPVSKKKILATVKYVANVHHVDPVLLLEHVLEIIESQQFHKNIDGVQFNLSLVTHCAARMMRHVTG
jgi:hypothetical protein